MTRKCKIFTQMKSTRLTKEKTTRMRLKVLMTKDSDLEKSSEMANTMATMAGMMLVAMMMAPPVTR